MLISGEREDSNYFFFWKLLVNGFFSFCSTAGAFQLLDVKNMNLTDKVCEVGYIYVI